MALATPNPRHPTVKPATSEGTALEREYEETQRVLLRQLGSAIPEIHDEITGALVAGRGERLIRKGVPRAVGSVPFDHVAGNPQVAADVASESIDRAIAEATWCIIKGDFDPWGAPIAHYVRRGALIKLVTVLRTGHNAWKSLVGEDELRSHAPASVEPHELIRLASPADLQQALDLVTERFRPGKRVQAADILMAHVIDGLSRSEIVKLRGYTKHQVRYVFRRLREIGRVLTTLGPDSAELSAFRMLAASLVRIGNDQEDR